MCENELLLEDEPEIICVSPCNTEQNITDWDGKSCNPVCDPGCKCNPQTCYPAPCAPKCVP